MSIYYDYNKLQIKALKLLTKFGGEITNATLVIENKGTLDGANGEYIGGGPDTEHELWCVKVDDVGDAIDKTLIKDGDVMLPMYPYSKAGVLLTPAIDNKVLIDSDEWNIERVKTIKPAQVPLLYILQCRK